MQMFALTGQNARFASFNPRPEKHGDENVPASDLQFKTSVPGVMLNLFENNLREAFYRKMKKDETAGDIVDQAEAPADGLVKLKFMQLDTFAWKREYPGYSLAIKRGIEDAILVELKDCVLRGIKFSPKDGGSVDITFSLATKPTEEQAGRIYGLMGDEVVIDLTLGGASVGVSHQTEARALQSNAKSQQGQQQRGGTMSMLERLANALGDPNSKGRGGCPKKPAGSVARDKRAARKARNIRRHKRAMKGK